MLCKKEALNEELHEINKRLEIIQQEILSLEIEKENLLKRKRESIKNIKNAAPSSTGGNKIDQASDWNRNG